MLTLPTSVKMYVATQPCDGRKGIDGLAALVRSTMLLDPLSGQMFVFFSRRSNRARILYFTPNGYWLLSKRLECGRFRLPWHASASAPSKEIESGELMLILEGIDLANARRRPRWTPRAKSNRRSAF
jgi:transposase